MNSLSNVFTSPRTTFAGLASLVLSQVGAYVVPQVVTFLGAQAGIGWQVAGLLIGLIVPAIMKDHKPAPVQPVP